MVKPFQSEARFAKNASSWRRRGSQQDRPELLAALEELYEIIAQYDLENIYNMDETCLFFIASDI